VNWRCPRTLLLALALAGLLAAVTSAVTAAEEPQVHTVYSGQRLGSIAKRYNVSVEALCNANGIRPSDPIRPGQRLLIPGPEDTTGDSTRRWREQHQRPVGSASRPTAPVNEPARGSPRTHVVYAGQTLGKIASRYHITVAELCRANHIDETDPIRPGQVLVIPPPGGTPSGVEATSPSASTAPTAPLSSNPQEESRPPSAAPASATGSTTPQRHVVASGHTLGKIAARYHVSIDSLCTANGITRHDRLQPGQVILVPGPGDPDGTLAARARPALAPEQRRNRPPAARSNGGASPTRSQAEPSWYPYRKPPWRRGYVTLVGYEQTWRGYVIGPDGNVLPAARMAFCRLMGAEGDHPRVDQRLVRLVVKVSDTFGGRPIRVVSGYRNESYALNSRHRRSQALDFSIPGVPNEALRDYVLTFPNVGVGYYPNSSFIHLDVRETKTYWVDLSGPGEPPRYAR